MEEPLLGLMAVTGAMMVARLCLGGLLKRVQSHGFYLAASA